MRLSTRGRFAITAMIDLALRESGQPVPLQEIAPSMRCKIHTTPKIACQRWGGGPQG